MGSTVSKQTMEYRLTVTGKRPGSRFTIINHDSLDYVLALRGVTPIARDPQIESRPVGKWTRVRG